MNACKSRVYTDRPAYADFDAPAKFTALQGIVARRLVEHPNAICSYSGGSDSDIMIDLIERVRKMHDLPPVKYVFFNTGLEMRATKRHVKYVATKYDVKIEPPFESYIYCTKPSKKHQTIAGRMILNDDELFKLPNGKIKYGDSVEMMLYENYTADNFLNGKVIGEFVCDGIDTYDDDTISAFSSENYVRWNDFDLNRACIHPQDFEDYANGKWLHGWHISDLVIYDKPKELSEFRKPLTTCHRGIQRDNCDGCWDCEIKRPPQSWCYAEKIEEEEK